MVIRCCVFAFALAVLAGCSKKSSEQLPANLHPVKGKLTKNGQSSGAGTVRFDPDSNQEYIVMGQVDATGSFELESVRGGQRSKGAPPGTYKVFFIPAGTTDQLESTPIETVKTYTIEATSNDLTIELIDNKK